MNRAKEKHQSFTQKSPRLVARIKPGRLVLWGNTFNKLCLRCLLIQYASKRISKWSHSVLNHILLYNLLGAHQQMRWQVFPYALLCTQHIILKAVWETRMNFSSLIEDIGPTLQPLIYCTVLFTSSCFSHAGCLPQGDSGSFSKPWKLCSIFMISAFSSLCRCFMLHFWYVEMDWLDRYPFQKTLLL